MASETCAACNGTGLVFGDEDCGQCTRPAPEYAGLVERLKSTTWGDNVADTLMQWKIDRDEAATTITRLTAENARQAAEIEGLIAAGNELSDKLWVLRCNSRDDKDREAAEKAYDMWTEARRPRALTGGQP